MHLIPDQAELCAELVDRWDDLGMYFGVNRSVAGPETRNLVSMESQVFGDAMARPRLAVFKVILETSK